MSQEQRSLIISKDLGPLRLEQCCQNNFLTRKEFLDDAMEKDATKVISWVSVLFVVISTIAMILNTMPGFQGPEDENGKPTENKILSMLETICIMWFTIEYILCFAGAPKKWAFLKNFMDVIDLLAILPFFVTVIVMEATPEGEPRRTLRTSGRQSPCSGCSEYSPVTLPGSSPSPTR